MNRRPDPPRYVFATDTEAAETVRRLAAEGWSVREGFLLAEAAGDPAAARLVLHGRVADFSTVQLAVLAAARGAGVVAVADTAGPVGRALVEDLSRLGPLGPGPEVAGADPVARLIPEQRALLNRLADGQTIAAAAAAEFLSLRTANRRIAQARELFGVRTTREAVAVYLRQRRGD